MDNYTTNQPRTGRENERPTSLGTLGGEFGLSWNDTVPLTTGAHNAFLSAFFEAGGVFDHLVDTCPLRLTSNNAPTNRETLGTAIVGMTNGSYRYRHFDNLSGDAVTAELFGIRRLMSCDSVRRNLKAIPMEAGVEWIWNANLHLVKALLDQDYILDMDPTVKPLYGHQEGRCSATTRRSPDGPRTATTRSASRSCGSSSASSSTRRAIPTALFRLKKIGCLRPKNVREVGASNFTIDGAPVDRDFVDFDK